MIHTQDADFTLYLGDVLAELANLPDESVHCVVTSPPYWGLRDYGTGEWAGGNADCDHKQGRDGAGRADGIVDERAQRNRDGAAALTRQECKCGARRVDQQLGLEPTPELYVARMVEVFREVRRVLRADGTCWVNLGDSYNANQGAGFNGQKRQDHANRHTVMQRPDWLKPKDLCGIPWRVAFALQADGWYLRSDIIWAKPNPMPESVTDRPTKSHEYVFLLTKGPRYFFDQEAVREPNAPAYTESVNPSTNQRRTDGMVPTDLATGGRWRTRENLAASGINPRIYNGSGRNVRTVWDIATQPYPEAHFATYPEELVRRCVLAGSSERGCCPVCGKPWERETAIDYTDAGRNNNSLKTKAGGDAVAAMSARPYETRKLKNVETLGWRPGCNCVDEEQLADGSWSAPILRQPIPCTILDPFLGSGTTAFVARKHGRRSIGIELNPAYADLAARRMAQQSLEFAL